MSQLPQEACRAVTLVHCTRAVLCNPTGSTTTVCAIRFNELAWGSVSHLDTLPLAFLCCVYVCADGLAVGLYGDVNLFLLECSC